MREFLIGNHDPAVAIISLVLGLAFAVALFSTR